MRYIDVKWIHDHFDEPVRIISEIGSDHYEKRKMEFFKNDAVGFAYNKIESTNTRLSSCDVPSLEDINSQEEFLGKEITKKEFESLWQEYGKRLTNHLLQ